jgi:elongation factor Ts
MRLDTKLVKELRDTTGAGVLDCKSALQETEGDLERAIELLRKRGLAKAEKRAGKPALEGRIGSYIHSNGKIGCIVELNCETDFVARNQEFQELLHDLCLQVVGAAPEAISKDDLSPEIIEKEKAIYEQDLKGKPPDIAARIIEGKLEKYLYSQKCLLHQPFINEAKFKGTVAELIKTKSAKLGENIVLRRFVRYQLGER